MIAFDTYQYVKDLKAAGFTEAQAEVHANWLKVLVENDLATKLDIELVRKDLTELELKLNARLESTKAELKHDIELTKAELKRDIEASKSDVLKWLIGLMVAQTGVIIAIVKLMPSVG